MTDVQNFWRKCSACKNPIGLGANYYVCSVSTCNGQRTGYVFCGMQCFERHLPEARHRDAGAIEKKAPMTAHNAESSQREPERRIVRAPSATTTAPNPSVSSSTPKEVLVIASRFKDYIAARSEYNTSASVMDVLSDHLRIVADRAIENARADGRRTVMDRDLSFLKNLK